MRSAYRLVKAIVYRTALITDPAARAKVDAEVAAQSSIGGRCRSPGSRRRSITGWIATTPMRCAASSSARGAAISTSAPIRTVPGCPGLTASCSAMTRLRWISDWRRWAGRCVRPIRAPLSSAALMRWARWPTAVIG